MVTDHDPSVTDVVGGRLQGRRIIAESGGDGPLYAGFDPAPGLTGQGGGQSMAAPGVEIGQGGGQLIDAVAVQESRVGDAGQKGRVVQHSDQKIAVGDRTVEP